MKRCVLSVLLVCLTPLLSAADCEPKPNTQPVASMPMEELTWTWVWNTTACAWQKVPTLGELVAIDTLGKWWSYSEIKSHEEELIGKELFSNPAKGEYVTFDITGTGNPIKISWPKPNTGIGWLVLDRDGDGVIKDGTEVIGSHTPHSDGDYGPQPCRKPEIEAMRRKRDTTKLPCNNNGFMALNFYDSIDLQSNMIIDKNDAVWPKLRVWIDAHCYKAPDVPCRSEPSELHRLEEYNISGIGFVTEHLDNEDTIGNRYRWYAPLNPVPTPHETRSKPSKDGRLAFDVYPTAVADIWPAALLPHD